MKKFFRSKNRLKYINGNYDNYYIVVNYRINTSVNKAPCITSERYRKRSSCVKW